MAKLPNNVKGCVKSLSIAYPGKSVSISKRCQVIIFEGKKHWATAFDIYVEKGVCFKEEKTFKAMRKYVEYLISLAGGKSDD